MAIAGAGLCAGDRYWFHAMDLRGPEEALFRSFSKDSVQRKIRRAERESLEYEESRTEPLLREFYRLLSLTRQRHLLPPQPFAWFQHLATSFGPALKVRAARYKHRTVAAILTLHHRNTVAYKCGGSDPEFHQLGGMRSCSGRPSWTRDKACTTLDLGRSDLDDEGLRTFKERWGAVRSEITYFRDPAPQRSSGLGRRYAERAARVLAHSPQVCRAAAGRLLYKHAG